MGKIVSLRHTTKYEYDKPIVLSPQQIRLRPAPHCHAKINAYALDVKPEKHFLNWQQDPFGNYIARAVFPEKVTHLQIDVNIILEIKSMNPFDFFLEETAQTFPFTYTEGLRHSLAPYLLLTDKQTLLSDFIAEIDQSPQSTIAFLVSLNQVICQHITYETRLAPGVQDCQTTLQRRTGSCRDMAWLLCQCLRHLGIATRFASGYLIQFATAPEENADAAAPTIELDNADLHAWTEAFIPGAGWIGLDPTSGLLASEAHIPLCCTPEPSEAAPVSGHIEPCETSMRFDLAVTRLHDVPATEHPFKKATWDNIVALGEHVDTVLQQHQVQLTMGGEPTFVSASARDAAEWNHAALGEDKRQCGQHLLIALQQHFAHGGLLLTSQGKWYSGESAPRWALNCYWRTDGEPIWNNTHILVDTPESVPDLADCEHFLAQLAHVLGVSEETILPAYEDSHHLQWQLNKLAENGAGDKLFLQQKKHLEEKLRQDFSQPVGFVLPLCWSHQQDRWLTSNWQFNQQQLLLLPGDSALGTRLPLSQLPNTVTSDIAATPPVSLLSDTQPLPSWRALSSDNQHPPSPTASISGGTIKTAVCCEIKNQQLHVFIPPINTIDKYLQLINACETVAQKAALNIVLEGYGPPKDNRLQSFSITPDPGVLEVNIHPADSWAALLKINQAIYQEAEKFNLTAEKFMIDGRHTGTGGGNHMTLGSTQPKHSPFLRRPDLLRSLLTFWQHHPCLSYFFTGLYVGSTSQAPRIDEARHDALYELEIAFQQLPREETSQFWLVDRLLRHLLVDVTGNTHRVEICIDKLFSPDTEFGRQGLVELRAFEMAPHWQLCSLQQLLVRALIAVFWQQPYHKSLIRWGSQLHDRFMLPYYLSQDLADVLAFLKEYAMPFQLDWFDAFFNFRFPEYGHIKIDNVELELRMALEPWNVLGEETQSMATSRLVDSATERLQVLVRDFIPEKHRLLCNGCPIPLHPTGRQGEYVAGVRFKAWPAALTLHPNLAVNAPLVFDLVDIHQQHSLGGCTYHVAHPGGKSYEHLPINSKEAESRRTARFQTFGHTPGKVVIPEMPANPEYPHTLDLRRATAFRRP